MNSPSYQPAAKKIGLNRLEDLLMPCALYHNFTGVDVYQKHSLGPWMIAFLLQEVILLASHVHIPNVSKAFTIKTEIDGHIITVTEKKVQPS
jgi:hypothetical protein